MNFIKKFQKRLSFIILSQALILTIMLFHQFSYSQSIESASEKFKDKKYSGAEREAREILKSDSENIDAKNILKEINQAREREKSQKLTKSAIIEINNRNFKTALELLKKAISIDPSNKKARELYLSIHEIEDTEKKVLEEEKEKREKKEREKSIAQKNEKDKVDIYNRRNIGLLKVSTTFTMSESNNLDYIDSDISMIGVKLDGRYYSDFLKRMFGLSADYSGYLYKINGEKQINFMVHRFNASVRLRAFLFEDTTGSLIVGIRINYHYLYLQNLKDEGVYNFKKIYGPSFGLFISDPVLYRVYKKRFFRDIGLEAEINYLYLAEKENSPSILEYYIGAYYNFNGLRFGAGYRSYRIKREGIKENYNDIEVSVGYIF